MHRASLPFRYGSDGLNTGWLARDCDLYELALAEWGQWDTEAHGGPPSDYYEDLVASYMSRQLYFQRNQAVLIANAVGELLGGGKPSSAPHHRGTRAPSHHGKRVSGGDLLGMMGKRFV